MTDVFIGDPISPDRSTFDPDRMATGEPGLPRRFTWRGEEVEIQLVLRTWKETGSCRNGSDEQYVNKHWYEVQTNHGTLKVYFERKSRGGAGGARWWLFSRSVTAAPEPRAIAASCRMERSGYNRPS